MDHSHDAAATAANQLFNHSEFPAPSRLRRGTSQQDLIGPWEFVPATEAESEQHELDTKQIAKQIADCRLQIADCHYEAEEQNLQRQVAKAVFVCF